MEQGSAAWHEWRRKGIGSSEIATILGVNPYETRYQLWLNKCGFTLPKDLSGNAAVQRGHELEPAARDELNKELSANFQPVTLTLPGYDFCKYSSDGLDIEIEEITEIKCMGNPNHLKMLSIEKKQITTADLIGLDDKHPLVYYMPQMQWGMMIARVKKCHFISYRPESTEPYKRLEVAYDPAYAENLLIEATKFWQLVQTQTAPELTKDDFLQIKDPEIDNLKAHYLDLNNEKKVIDEVIAGVKKRLIELTDGKNIITTGGAKIFTSIRKGHIDYDKIPELEGVDLEAYRKPPTTVFNIK